ncbi:hypothetical protein B0H19DRAFT_1300084 [Mycena capillaripes]|nr:hypothetical protein B0H19DRAFT_1300084 [Mycena capillaripes]
MAGYQKPRLYGYSTLRPAHLLISTLLELSLNLFLPCTNALDSFYFSVYISGFLTIWSVVLGHFFFPVAIKMPQLFNVNSLRFHRSHISHMRIDRLRRCLGYQNPQLRSYSLPDFLARPHQVLSGLITLPLWASLVSWSPSITWFTHFGSACPNTNSDNSDYAVPNCMDVNFGLDSSGNRSLGTYLSCLFRGGYSPDDNEFHNDDGDDFDSDVPGLSGKRKRNNTKTKPRKLGNKGKGKARADIESDTSLGIRVTVGRGKQSGIYVDEVVNIDSAPEYWDVHNHRVAYVLDVMDTPECPQIGHRTATVDKMIKKQCQDSLDGPTGSRDPDKLAEVLILDDDIIIDCRRSNLSCYYLEDFERGEDDSEDLILAPIRAARSAEAGSLIAIATEFHRSVISKYCLGSASAEDFACGGHAVMRKFSEVFYIWALQWEIILYWMFQLVEK